MNSEVRAEPALWSRAERSEGDASIRRLLKGRWRFPRLESKSCHRNVTHSRNQKDTGGHKRTRRLAKLSAGGHERKRRDTRGHDIRPVRDREAPGSNPGPRPVFGFKTRSLRPTRWRFLALGVTGGSQDRGTLRSFSSGALVAPFFTSCSHRNQMPYARTKPSGMPLGFTHRFRGACPRLQAIGLTPD
jgi:hypothetical protein